MVSLVKMTLKIRTQVDQDSDGLSLGESAKVKVAACPAQVQQRLACVSDTAAEQPFRRSGGSLKEGFISHRQL